MNIAPVYLGICWWSGWKRNSYKGNWRGLEGLKADQRCWLLLLLASAPRSTRSGNLFQRLRSRSDTKLEKNEAHIKECGLCLSLQHLGDCRRGNEFQTSLGYTERLCLQRKQKKKNQRKTRKFSNIKSPHCRELPTIVK